MAGPVWNRRTGLLAGAAGILAVGVYAGAARREAQPARITHPKTGAAILVPGQDGDTRLLHNGWRIRPAGRHVQTGDMLLGGALSPDGKTYAVVNAGYTPNALNIIDVATEKQTARVPIPRCWNGIAWAKDGQRLYVAGGVSVGASDIYTVDRAADGSWARGAILKLTGNEHNRTCVAGLALSADGKTLFALNNQDRALYALDAQTGEGRARLVVGNHPYACRLSGDGKTLYVANLGGSEVTAVDVSDPAHPAVASRIPTGEHPNDLAFSADGRLFVTCGNSDTVTVYDLNAKAPSETIRTSLTPNAPAGSTPDALALSPDGNTLYVANADNNDVCVVDVLQRGHSRVRGFIPAGWYPTAIAVTADGKRLLVGSGKGTGTGPNMPRLAGSPMSFRHMGNMLNGSVSFVDAPNDAQLAEYTRQVTECSPYRSDAQVAQANSTAKTAVPTHVGEASPIKYVLYIIKENRTYDQMLGDMKQGNGDPDLCLFGADVTPNHHALASQFVLLDNLYCNGEVSQDGHPWCDSAYCTDYTERAWVMAYSGKGKLPEPAAVSDPQDGYIWQAAERAGLSFRSYGEKSNHKSLADHHSLAFIGKLGPNQPAPGRDTDKADIFIQEFKDYEKKGDIPRFMVMSLGEDHTRGTTPGAFTPRACVASNDQALGKIVDAISHSSVWNQFAIFVIEDDAQNGPDHVDSHRTMGLVISPYTKRGVVDSTMYSTASMLRTMELLLGIKPLTQYDASATPMFASFSEKPDLTSYTLVPPRIDVNARNGMAAYGARESAKMDWSDYDRAPEDALNRILWHSIKGPNVPMPAPVRSAAVRTPAHAAYGAAASRRDADDD